MADLKITNIPAPHDGIDLASPPESMSPTRAPWMENFLIGNYGRLPVRGGIYETRGPDTTANKLKYIAAYVKDPAANYQYVTRGDNVAVNKIRPDEIPIRGAGVNADLDRGVTYDVSGAPTLTYTLFGRGATSNKSSYFFEYHSDALLSTQDAPILSGPRQWKRKLVKLSNAGCTSYAITAAPSCGVDVEVHNNLLWVLGGYPAAPTTEEFTTSCLFWTGGGDAATWGGTATFGDLQADGSLKYGSDRDWRNSKNVINRIEIPGSDLGKAIVKLNQNLVIFKEKSIWILYGSDDDSYTLRNVTNDTGLWDRDSIVEADGGIYFRSIRGFEFFDGSSSTVVSEVVAPVFDYLNTPGDFYTYRCTAGLVDGNYIEMRMEKFTETQAPIALQLHRSTRNWTVFTGTGYGYRAKYMRVGGEFIEQDRVYTTTQLGAISPHTAATSFGVAFRTLPAAKVYYRAIRLSGIAAATQLQRVFLDTKAALQVASNTAWTWTGLSSSQVSYVTSTEDPIWTQSIVGQDPTLARSPALGSAYWQGRRDVVDTVAEVEDLMFKVVYVGGLSAYHAELRGGGVEFADATPRHTPAIRGTVPR